MDWDNWRWGGVDGHVGENHGVEGCVGDHFWDGSRGGMGQLWVGSVRHMGHRNDILVSRDRLHNRLEPVDGIGCVGYGPDAPIRVHEGVLPLDHVPVPGLRVGLLIPGQGIADPVVVLEVWVVGRVHVHRGDVHNLGRAGHGRGCVVG